MSNSNFGQIHRVLIISPDLDYYKDNRGIFRFSVRLITALAGLGYKVDLLTSAAQETKNISKWRRSLGNLRIINHLAKSDIQRISSPIRRSLSLSTRRLISQAGLLAAEKPFIINNDFDPLEYDITSYCKEYVGLVDRWYNLPFASSDIVKNRYHFNIYNSFLLDCTGYQFAIATQPYRIKTFGAPLFSIYHDLFPVLSDIHPDAMDQAAYNFVKNYLHSERVICISHSTKMQLIKLLSELNISNHDKIRVVQQSVKAQASALVSFSLENEGKDGSTSVCIGTIEERKQQHMLYTAFLARPELKSCKLVLVGAADVEHLQLKLPLLYRSAIHVFAGNEKVLQKSIECGVAFTVKFKNIIWYCNASDYTKSSLLAASNSLLFPSINEGYGIPVVEGMSLGIPVIVRDIRVFRAISGSLCWFSNENELIELIVQYSGKIHRLRSLIAEALSLQSDQSFAQALSSVVAENMCTR